MKNINRPQDIDNSTPPPKKTLDIVCPLPVLFLCSVLIIAVLNMTNFFTSYKTAMEEKPNNKQAALSSIETKYTSSFAGKTNYVDINGLFSRLVDKKEMNDVVRLENGYLIQLHSQVETSTHIENMLNFNEYLNLYGYNYCYIQAPHILSSDSSELLPNGYVTFTNSNVNSLLSGINDEIPILDLRDSSLYTSNSTELFFKTDAHWTVEAAFHFHQEVVNFITEIGGMNIETEDYFNLTNYEVVRYKNIVLGSWGRIVGVFFSGAEDISVIIPNFETSISLSAKNSTLSSGSFENVFFNSSKLDKHFAYVFSPYTITDTDYYKIENDYSMNETSVFIISDSFMQACAPFLSLHFNETHLFNLKNGTKEEMLELIHNVNPDIVVQITSAGELWRMSRFEFLTSSALSELEKRKSTQEEVELINAFHSDVAPKYYIDNFEQNKNNIYIRGWSFVENMETENQNVFILLTEPDGSQRMYDTTQETRTGVSTHFENNLYTESGFYGTIDLGYDVDLSENINLQIVVQVEDTYYLSDFLEIKQ